MKFILIMKICSALSGNCLPEHNGGVHDTWYDCAAAGSLNTLNCVKIMTDRNYLFSPLKPISHFPRRDRFVYCGGSSAQI